MLLKNLIWVEKCLKNKNKIYELEEMAESVSTGYLSIMIVMMLFIFGSCILLILGTISLHGDDRSDFEGAAKKGFDWLITVLVFSIIFALGIIGALAYVYELRTQPIFEKASFDSLICLTALTTLFLIASSYSASFLATDPNYKTVTNYTIGAATLYGLTILLGIGGCVYVRSQEYSKS